MQTVFSARTSGPGLYEFTAEVARFVRESGIDAGLLTLFVQHTSCSLLVRENADSDVRQVVAYLSACDRSAHISCGGMPSLAPCSGQPRSDERCDASGLCRPTRFARRHARRAWSTTRRRPAGTVAGGFTKAAQRRTDIPTSVGEIPYTARPSAATDWQVLCTVAHSGPRARHSDPHRASDAQAFAAGIRSPS